MELYYSKYSNYLRHMHIYNLMDTVLQDCRVASSRLMALDSIRPPEPENVWILLSRHEARLAH